MVLLWIFKRCLMIHIHTYTQIHTQSTITPLRKTRTSRETKARLQAEAINATGHQREPGPGPYRRLQAEAIKVAGPQREPGPGQYRRAEAGELYKTGARGGCSRRRGRGCSRRMEQRRSSRGRRRKEKEEGRRKEEEEEQTDKIREPLTEVRE